MIKTLREGLPGNAVSRVYGILNGTCNYILSRMEREGLTFEACLKDEALYGEVGAVSQRAHDVFQVDATPTFFINGRRLDGAVPLSEMERVIKPLLGA